MVFFQVIFFKLLHFKPKSNGLIIKKFNALRVLLELFDLFRLFPSPLTLELGEDVAETSTTAASVAVEPCFDY